ncbi:MAG: DUF4249 family protein [Bacteroides sp.]|nr:DUF4249 family protein [Bacteroides sp.]
MEILKKIIFLIIPLFLTGCYEDFTPEIDVKPVLCLNGLITAGKPIEISVTHTKLYTDTDNFTQVEDVMLHIYANDRPVSGEYLAQEGDRIRIHAESPEYGSAEAEVTVPVSVPIEFLEFEATATNIWRNTTVEMLADVTFNLKALMKINDPAKIANYYNISYISFNPHEDDGNLSDDFYDDDNLYGEDDSYNDEYEWNPPITVRLSPGTFKYETEPIFSEHIGTFETVITGSDTYGFSFFSDRQFSGKSYTLHLQFENMNYYVNHDTYNEEMFDCGLIFYLNTISASYYNWSNYRWQVQNGILGDLSDIGLADPMWGYSNVSTGAGVIAAQAFASYTLSLKDFLKNILPPDNTQL